MSDEFAARIRMYRQGLGDCFLLSFPAGDGRLVHVLIDCGVLTGTPRAAEEMQFVAANILDTTGGHLDVLVATHEHWDHVSGFLHAEDLFDKLSIGEVWLAWTEDPHDHLANDLRRGKEQALKAIEATVQRLRGRRGVAGRTRERLNGLLSFYGELGVQGRKTTTRAFEWIKDRESAKQARMVYLRPGDAVFSVPGTADARVYVLGPPRDKKLLRKDLPSKRHPEVYELENLGSAAMGFLAAVDALESTAKARFQPFDPWFNVALDEARTSEFFSERYFIEDDWRSIEYDWLAAAERLALRLDSDTNNTCLVLAFELSRGRILLFPGDAQVGNWLSWEDVEWQLEDGERTKKVTSSDLLARTVLYKVGHHGSHNATLRDKGLELMTSEDLTAMIPVNRAMAAKQEWNMPFPPLLERLEERTLGRIIDMDLGIRATKPPALTQAKWDHFVRNVVVNEKWIDYTFEV